MSLLYYRLEVWNEKETGVSKTYRKATNLGVPSPLGTELFIPVDSTFMQDFHTYVVGHEHCNHYSRETETHEFGIMYMVLGVTEKGDKFYAGEGGGATSENPEPIWDSLVENGWEEISG